MLKMYVVVRGDLEPAQKAVQASHAMADFAVEHPVEFKEWQGSSNVLVLLEVPGEYRLLQLAQAAKDGNFKHTAFVEPDAMPIAQGVSTPPRWSEDDRFKTYTTTAVAFAPNWLVQHVLLARLPLAMTEPKKKKRKKRRWFQGPPFPTGMG